MTDPLPKIFCLLGPTASGKTTLACKLLETFPFEIISVDSAMIYKGMNIGTAKLTEDELLKAPHHLIDLIDPSETYSVAEFCKDVLSLSHDIIQRGKIPLLVGGSMMYFKALQQGLSALPSANETIRKQLEKDAEKQGLDALYQRLEAIDPKAALRIHRHDSQRIQRALEVYYLTGSSLSEVMAKSSKISPFQFVNFILFPKNRAWLHERIAKRFIQMVNEGLIEEVKQLQRSFHLNSSLPSMRSVGYKQALEFLEGDMNESEFIEKGIAATRQLAKRQLTWLKRWESGYCYDPQNKTFMDDIIAKIQEILDNNPPRAAKEP